MKQKSSVDRYKEDVKQEKNSPKDQEKEDQENYKDVSYKIAYCICFLLTFSAGAIMFYLGQAYLPYYIQKIDKNLLNIRTWKAGLKYMIFWKFAYMSACTIFICTITISFSRLIFSKINPYSTKETQTNKNLNTVDFLNKINLQTIFLTIVFNSVMYCWFYYAPEPGNVAKVFTTAILFNFGRGGTFLSEFMGQFIKVPTQDIFGQTLTYCSLLTILLEASGYSIYPYLTF